MNFTISQNAKDHFKHALISILIGSAVAFLTTLLEGLLHFLKDGSVDFSGTGASMVYYMLRRPRNMA